MKIIHITDPHLVAPGERLWGLDTFARFNACLDDVAKWHSDAEFCFISGDLTDRGNGQTYPQIAERLASFPLRTVLMIGNHDSRENFLDAFPDAPRDENGFVQEVLDTAHGRFLFLDTVSEPGNSAGWYCADRRAWFAAQLEAAPGEVYIAMHHPPFDIGISYMDRIKLEDHEAFADIAIPSGKVRHIFFGHVHRAVFGTWRGIAYSALPGINHQVPLHRDAVGSWYSDEPPMYAIITLGDEQTLIHYDGFYDRKSLPEPPKGK
ncbi:MAG: phosphodiesterase [Hyphomicrobiales bacterium]